MDLALNKLQRLICHKTKQTKPNQSKVIKTFVPELRSRYVFFVFRDSYVLCKYVMNILCTFHISVSGYSTYKAKSKKQKITYFSIKLFNQCWFFVNSNNLQKCIISIYFALSSTPFLFDQWVECSSMARETGVQSQVESYQRLKKW